MAFCPNCGAAATGRFCDKCGTAIGNAAGSPAGATPARTGLDENVASALCYVLGLITGILFLVISPYNQNRNIRFHAFQSILLHVAWIVAIILEGIVVSVIPFIAPLLNAVVLLGGIALWIYMLFTAYQGRKVKLPVIGDIAEKQA